jgi:condensin-2 complex subunit G2
MRLWEDLTVASRSFPSLVALAVAYFELAWRANAPGCEALIAQTLPYLMALLLTFVSSTRSVLCHLFVLY